MPPLTPVTVKPVSPERRPAVLTLSLPAEQQRFAGQMPGLLQDAEADAQSEPMAVLAGEEVVGYYRLDFAPGSVAGRDFGVPSVGLRAFFIAAGWQGRGLGTAAMTAMQDDLRRRHPATELLALSVNVLNPGARQVYLKAGFQDHGELYLGGAAGPQHVMVRDLRDR